jgi:4a-hydroxytetrahydrobiopterin dehydratase
MADTILTESEASLAVEDLGWRYLLDCLTTAVTVDSLSDASDVIGAAVAVAGPDADDHLRLRATADRVELTLQTRGEFAVTTRDVDLARTMTTAVRTAGYQTVAHPAHHSVQSLAIAIDAMDLPAVRAFWKAVLGYDEVTAPADLVDPFDGGPSVWFQQMDEPRTQRNRVHLDLTVPHDDAVARVEAALAAGGRLVSDDHARAFWILADPEGNEVCVCTWQDRD